MKLRQLLGGLLVAAASVGMVLPQGAYAASAQLARPASSGVRDVALHDGGCLTGQVLDAAGTPVAGTAVAVIDQSRALASTQTGADGRFAIAGLKAGVYEVATSNGVTVCRLWAPRTAPPAAQGDALVVHGDTVVRGGLGGGGGVIGFLSNPWVLGGIVAAAIAIPLLLDDDDAS
jgi:hypothetical protein